MKLLRARVTSKGQVTLPKTLRDSLGIHEGDQVEFAVNSPKIASIRKLKALGSSAGALRHLAEEKPVSVEDMDEAIRNHMRKRYVDRRSAK
ncbi:MAG: AbrB/MazE/SpoVT family DNA-binding domain-containing protein [Opitutales bacterium]